MKRQQSPAFYAIGGVIQQVDGQRFVCGITRLASSFFASSLRFSWLQPNHSAESILRHQYTVECNHRRACRLRFHFINNDIAVHT